jgi:hypothetical protein
VRLSCLATAADERRTRLSIRKFAISKANVVIAAAASAPARALQQPP